MKAAGMRISIEPELRDAFEGFQGLCAAESGGRSLCREAKKE